MTLCGAEVAEAASGAEALRAIRNAVVMNKPYKIVLLDMRMPDTDGLELVKRLRQEQLPTSPVIPMVYSDDIRPQVAQFKEHGLDNYLVKPIRRRELHRAIGRKLATAAGVSPYDHLHDHQLQKIAPKPALSLGGRCMRVLIAEDSTDNRFLIEAYLRKEPCTITFVPDGEQAVDKAMSNDYDLIFMDIQMPNKDGLAATRAIRKWESECGRTPIPIVALTASALEEDVEQSLRAGCNAHISKPVKKRVILQAIRDVALRRPTPRAILH
jgi:CheY-like chemotaxis protein